MVTTRKHPQPINKKTSNELNWIPDISGNNELYVFIMYQWFWFYLWSCHTPLILVLYGIVLSYTGGFGFIRCCLPCFLALWVNYTRINTQFNLIILQLHNRYYCFVVFVIQLQIEIQRKEGAKE